MCLWSSTNQTALSGSYGLIVIECGRCIMRIVLHEVLRIRQQVALAVEHQDVALPLRVDAHLVAGALPRLHAAPSASWPLPPFPGGLELRRVAPRQPADREEDARPHVAQLLRHRPLDVRQLAVLNGVDAIGTLGEHARSGAERPRLVTRNGREILWPAGDDVVATEDVLAALLVRNSRNRRDAALSGRPRAVQEISRRQADEAGQQDRYAIAHVSLSKMVGDPDAAGCRL